MRKGLTIAALAFAVASMSHMAIADPAAMGDALNQIARQWAHITYQVTDQDAQEHQMKQLAATAAKLVAQYPDRAAPLVWEGVIVSSEAQYANMFSALGFAKEARAIFEKAGRLDFRALHGAIPTSLGVLYYKVPGFPIGFGDNEKARQYLEQGLQIDPDGLDANYFYGEFLFDRGDYRKAAAALTQALHAPPDPARPVWYAGRRAQVRSLLAKINAELASNH
jgi:tetratricopeptide (TPR) repeat protein